MLLNIWFEPVFTKLLKQLNWQPTKFLHSYKFLINPRLINQQAKAHLETSVEFQFDSSLSSNVKIVWIFIQISSKRAIRVALRFAEDFDIHGEVYQKCAAYYCESSKFVLVPSRFSFCGQKEQGFSWTNSHLNKR